MYVVAMLHTRVRQCMSVFITVSGWIITLCITVIILTILRTWLRNDVIINDLLATPTSGSCQGEGLTYIQRRLLGEMELQVVQSRGYLRQMNFYLFAAYLDGRHGNHVSVRVTGMLRRSRSRVFELDIVHCRLWYGESLEHDVVVAKVINIWPWRGAFQSVMVTCPVPRLRHTPPSHVSVVEGECGSPTNLLPVHAPPERRETVSLCTKVSFGSPDAVRLVEWIEMNRILGVERIYMYNTSISGPTNDVLRHYVSQGYVDLTQHTFPTIMAHYAFNQSFPTADINQNWLIEMMSMNDCLYRARADFVINMDIDEVLYLQHGMTLRKFIKQHALPRHPNACSYMFHTAVASDELGADVSHFPSFLHLMTHNKRTAVDRESPKSILRTDCCQATGHHVCLHSLPGFLIRGRNDVVSSVGYVRHYRRKCRLTEYKDKCKTLLSKPIVDNTLRVYAGTLLNRVVPIIQKLALKV